MTDKIRSVAEVEADIEALAASGKKNPRKTGDLRQELINALKAELSAANTMTVEVPEAPSPTLSPYSSIDFSDEFSKSGEISPDGELVDRIIERFASKESRSGNLRTFWNRIRGALQIRRVMCGAAGIEIPGREIVLGTFDTLGIDAHTGEKIEKAPEPKPAPAVHFESEVARDARLVEESVSRDQATAARAAEALADTKRGQLTTETDEKRAKRAREAELARAGAAPGMPSL